MPDLDHRQRAAVDAGPVDVFISAGAGSGKTHVLTSRLLAAVLGHAPYDACEPGELLAVTYTEKAAGELAERIRQALVGAGELAAARSIGDAWISTIHGMCARILRQHAFDCGIDPHFGVLDQVASSALESDALEQVIAAAVEADPATVDLIDTYGFETVAQALRSVRASIRALGMDPGAIATLEPEEALGRLRDRERQASELVADLASLPEGKTTAAWLGAATSVRDALASGLAADLADPDALRTALALPKGIRTDARIGGLNEAASALRALVERAVAAVDQLAVAPHERAFMRLLNAFEQRFSLLKAERGMLDFEDLQVKTAELLEGHPDITEQYRRKFRMLMLDESQDSNELQMRIIESLARENLCTVGDENQSIYAFRYADVEVFRRRGQHVTARQQLDMNYRTAPELLDALNGLFARPELFGPDFMQLEAGRPRAGSGWPTGAPRFELRFVDSAAEQRSRAEAEAACVADRVAELIELGVEPGDIAVLMRALARGRGARVERALTARGIRAYLASGGAFFEAPEVLETRALLRVIDNVWDDAALATVLAGRFTGLGPGALLVVREHAGELAEARGLRRSEAHLWDALESPGLSLDRTSAAAVRRTIAAVELARRMRGVRPLSDTVLEPLMALDVDLVLFAAGPGGSRAWGNVLKLARMASEYETAVGGDLGGFLEHLALREAHTTSEQEATVEGEIDAVRIMSIHAAKGLEFGAVVVAGLGSRTSDTRPITFGRVDGRPMIGLKRYVSDESAAGGRTTAPTLASQAIAEHGDVAADAEARRLLYVACTRAIESLTVIATTRPDKAADSGLPGVMRAALGFGDAGSIVPGDHPVGSGSVRVSIAGAACEAEPESEALLVTAETGEPAIADLEPTPLPRHGGAVPQLPVTPPAISYTGLSRYRECPYSYYLTRVLRLPAPPAMQQGEALAFGSAVHAVLERCRSAADDPGEWIDRASQAASLSPAGRNRLRAVVNRYLGSPLARAVFDSDRVMREAPIAVPVAGTVLNGAIDVIAWNGADALIVDFKTGSGPLFADEASERYRLQGQCYALAALSAGAESVRVVFAELERDRETPYEYRARDRGALETLIGETVERIAAEGFPVREGYEEGCELCPGLGGMCPITRPGAGASA